MTKTNQATAPASSSLTIEGMADDLGLDAMLDALDTEDAGHPDGAPNGQDTPTAPAKKKRPARDESEDDEEDTSEADDETEGDDTDDESGEETTDDETPDEGADALELETTEVESLFGLNDGTVAVDEDGKLTFKTKIDGEEGQVHLDTLVESYQIKGHLTKQSQKFAEEKTQAQAYIQQQAQTLSNQLEGAAALTEAMRERLVAQNNATDWEKLRTEDPAEYAAKRQELGEQYRQVDGYLEQIQQQRQQQAQQSYNEEQTRMQGYLQEEGRKLLSAIPEWSDAAVRTTEMGEIKAYLATRGFDPAEISNIVDSRHVLILRDALKAQAVTDKVTTAKKRVARIPKVIKPGAKTSSRKRTSRTVRAKALSKQKKTGSINDTAAVMYNLLGDDI